MIIILLQTTGELTHISCRNIQISAAICVNHIEHKILMPLNFSFLEQEMGRN